MAQSAASGRLVGIASVVGIRGLPTHGAYLRIARLPSSVTVKACAASCAARYCVSSPSTPGYVDTPLTRQNRFAMQAFLMALQDFARCEAFRATAAGASYRVIPWQMAVVAGCCACKTPAFDALFDRLLARAPTQAPGRTMRP